MGLKIPGFIIVWVRPPLPVFVTFKANKRRSEMTEKTREQRMADVDKRISDFSSKTKEMYELAEDIVEVYKVFDGECEKVKNLDVDEKARKKTFDIVYYGMVNDVKKVINEHDINPDTLKILENVLFEDERVDSRLFLLVMTCWSLVNVDKYPLEALSISSKVYASFDD